MGNNRIKPTLVTGVQPRDSSLSFEEQTLADVEAPILTTAPPDKFERTEPNEPSADDDYLLPDTTDYAIPTPLKKNEAEIKAQFLKDATEVHQAKVSIAWIATFPVLGPIIVGIITLFSNPATLAENRLEVQTGERYIEEGVDQEKRMKKAKLKALFVTTVPQVASFGLIVAHQLIVEGLLKEANVKLSDPKAVAAYLANNAHARIQKSHALLGLGLLLGASSFVVPLGYLLGENPADPNFNKKL